MKKTKHFGIIFVSYLLISCSLFHSPGISQVSDSFNLHFSARYCTQRLKADFLNSGNLDIMNTGQLSASTRLIRFFIGEPGRIAIPIFVYSGVSANNFHNAQSPSFGNSNEQLIGGFINPLSGIVNICTVNRIYFQKARSFTRAALLIQGGTRILTGYRTGNPADPQTGNPVNFLNNVTAVGVYLETAAWEGRDTKNVGRCWSSIRYIWTVTSPKLVKEFLTQASTNGIYHGYCFGGGIEINNLLNLKIQFYKYKKAPEIGPSAPIYQFSFNYTVK